MWSVFLEILIPIVAISGTIITAEIIRRQLKSYFYRKMERMGLGLAEKLENELKNGRERADEATICKDYLNTAKRQLSKNKSVNRLHTIENYKSGYLLGHLKHKYSQKIKLYKNILLSEKFDPNLVNVDFISPDWVREFQLSYNTYEYDNRTYIQCFHRALAEEFKEYFDNNYNSGKLSPYVGELHFNRENSNLKPFRVSCPDRLVYEKGMHLLVGLVQEFYDKIQNFNMEVFPINIKEYGNYKGDCFVTELKDFKELTKFSDELSVNVIKMENQRKVELAQMEEAECQR